MRWYAPATIQSPPQTGRPKSIDRHRRHLVEESCENQIVLTGIPPSLIRGAPQRQQASLEPPGRGCRWTPCWRGVDPSAGFALVSCYSGYSTNLPLGDLTDHKALGRVRL